MKTTMNSSRQRYLYKGYAFLILLSIVSFQLLQAKEFTRTYTGSSPVALSDVIAINTSHCKSMVINTTDKKTASYELKIILDINEEEESIAKEIFDEIEFGIDKSNGKVEMDLKWPFSFSSSKNFISGYQTKISVKDGGKYELSGKPKVKMVAVVNIPKANKLKLAGAHSNFELGHLSNEVVLSMSHSKIKANDVKGATLSASHSTVDIGNIELPARLSLSHSKLNGLKMDDAEISCSHSQLSFIEADNIDMSLSHSNADMDNCGDITISSIQHSDLEMKTVKNLDISSTQHSTIDIEKANNVEVSNGQHGKIAIQELNRFRFKSGGFTKIYIGTVNESIEVSTQHSDMAIDALNKEIKLVDVENQFASVTLGAGNISNFNLLVQDGKNTTIRTQSDVVKKSDGYYTKRTNSGNILEINIECPHCTVNIE